MGVLSLRGVVGRSRSSRVPMFGIAVGIFMWVLCSWCVLPAMANSPFLPGCASSSTTHTLYISRVVISDQGALPSGGDSHNLIPSDIAATAYTDAYGNQGDDSNLLANMDTGGGSVDPAEYTISVSLGNTSGATILGVRIFLYLDYDGDGNILEEIPIIYGPFQVTTSGRTVNMVGISGVQGYDIPEAGMRVIASSALVPGPCVSDYGNGETEDFKIRFAPDTMVELSSFTAQASAGGVDLAWETLSEKDCAGFYLWRSKGKNGKYQRISDIIEPQGDEFLGASYFYEDTSVTLGKRYFYKLEDVDSSTGESTFHGPVSAKAGKVKK